jgi:ribonucleotide reductase alpha subunit
LIPQLKIYNEAARTFNQGGKRKGAFSIYVEPWHGDIMGFLKLKLNHGDETLRTRDLFPALWIPDLFYKRLHEDTYWSLFSQNEAPGLSDVYDGMEVCSKCGYCANGAYAKYILNQDVPVEGCLPDPGHCEHEIVEVDAFTQLYTSYEERGLATDEYKAWEVMDAICEMQRESGTPYHCLKDNVNRTSNQKNIGTIKSSNLCVSGDTYILTSHGYMLIKNLKDREVTVWNGQQWSTVTVRQTGINVPCVEVRFNNGRSLKCTEYHKFHLINEVIKSAAKLVIGDIVRPWQLPTIVDGEDLSADTCSSLLEAKLSDKLNWLGCLNEHFTIMGDELWIATDYADTVFLMLQSIGIETTMTENIVHITAFGVEKLRKLGFTHPIMELLPLVFRPQPFMVKVSSIRLIPPENTYCFNEPLSHTGIFNGILTGNCTEIMEYSSETSYATCTLASINLKKFVSAEFPLSGYENWTSAFNFEKLRETVRDMVINLDNLITVNTYPVPECENNAYNYRPIGVGVQGLADVFVALKIPFLSEAAEKLDLAIFETIYYAALQASAELAQTRGSYVGFEGSPISKGIFAFDMWQTNQLRIDSPIKNAKIFSGIYDWEPMRELCKKGMRNSLLVAPMPTVSTSQIMGNNESFEPFSANIFTKGTLSGKYTMSNNAMIKHLITLGLWTPELKNQIINLGGSVQLTNLPDNIKEIYLTVWEMKQSALMTRAAKRQAFVDQSQSLNIHFKENSDENLRAVFLAAYRLGLKTGSYYIRTLPPVTAMKNNIADAGPKPRISGDQTVVAVEMEGEEECTMCSS